MKGQIAQDFLAKTPPKIAVFSVIRRWDDYVPKTIDSVLAQSYENWEWYIHTGPDSEGKLEEYCKNSPQIHLIHGMTFHSNAENMEQAPKLSEGIVATAQKGDYFCVIDGDDRLTPDFMEHLLLFILEHDLDGAACGVINFDSEGNFLNLKDDFISKDLIIQQKDFLTHFPLYQLRFWTMWGKLSKSSLFSAELYETMPRLRSTNDAPITLPTLTKAKRIGMSKKIGYHYARHTQGMSFQNFHPFRETEPELVYGIVEKTLEEINEINGTTGEKMRVKGKYAALFSYLGTLRFTIAALLESQRSDADKITLFHQMYSHPLTREALDMVVTQRKFLTSFPASDPYHQWDLQAVEKSLIALKMNFFNLITQILKNKTVVSSESGGKLLEILALFAQETEGKLSYGGLCLLVRLSKVNFLYFNLNQEKSVTKKLIQEMTAAKEKLPTSMELAEVLALVADKTEHHAFYEESLPLKLSYYQKNEMMEEMMAVMDVMIEKNIQFQ